MKKDYVFGGGPAGIIFAYLSGYDIIDANPMGQVKFFDNNKILGPRLIEQNSGTMFLLETLRKNKIISKYSSIESFIGYQRNGIIKNTFDDDFLKRYTEIAREKDASNNIESSFLSGQKNSIRHLLVDDYRTGYSYVFLIETIYNILEKEGRVIKANVIDLDIDKKTISIAYVDKNIQLELNFRNCVNTIRYDKFLELVNHQQQSIDKTQYQLKTKNFAFVENHDDSNDYGRILYHYIYSVDGEYTRKTFYNDYVCYETVEPKNKKDSIDINCEISCSLNNVPIQIKNSLNIESYKGIQMLGRYAQWNHKIKIGEVVNKSLAIIRENCCH